jgi:hypothetical protein
MGQYKQINRAKVLSRFVPLSASESCLAFAPKRLRNYKIVANLTQPQQSNGCMALINLSASVPDIG